MGELPAPLEDREIGFAFEVVLSRADWAAEHPARMSRSIRARPEADGGDLGAGRANG